MVIENKAGLQFMGDWAKGEFVKAEKVPGTDFVCMRFPGTQGAVTFNSDQFAMFKVAEDKVPAQLQMASAIENPTFQSAFNVVKGSAPARTDVPDTDIRRLRQEGDQGPRRSQCAGPALWFHGAWPCQPGGGEECDLRRRNPRRSTAN